MCEPLKAVDSGATWRWLSLKHCHLIQATILLLLLPDILADRLLICANGRHKIPSRPEMLARKVLLPILRYPHHVILAFPLCMA